MSSHNWGPIGTAAMIGIETGLERARRTYIRGFTWLVIASVLMITLGVALNKHGYLLANFYLAAGFLVAWAFFTFYPASIISIFGIGGLKGLPTDWSVNRLLREGALPDLELSNIAKEGFSLIRKYVIWSSHLALFVVVVFVTLGTWRLERGSIVLPVFIVLAGSGFWAALFTKGSVWYKRVVIAILLVSLAGLVYTGYTHTHPQDETVALIDRALVKNDDLIKERTAKALYEKVQQGIALTPEEIRLLESLQHESKRIGNATNAVIETLPGVPFSASRKSASQSWQLFDRIECPVGWNDREGGPWCDPIELPNGSYRFIVERTMWKHADLGPDGTFSYFDMPPEGLSLSSFPAASHSFKREFWQGAPCGGNGRLGAVVIKTSTVNCYDPFVRGTPPLVIASAKPKEKVLIGTNFPLNRLYVQADLGKIIIEVERLQ